MLGLVVCCPLGGSGALEWLLNEHNWLTKQRGQKLVVFIKFNATFEVTQVYSAHFIQIKYFTKQHKDEVH